MQLGVFLLLSLLCSFQGVKAAVFAQDKLSAKVKPCKGHYVYFETEKCPNRHKLKPRIVSTDGLIKLEPTNMFKYSICGEGLPLLE
jgi:hypothetical protein